MQLQTDWNKFQTLFYPQKRKVVSDRIEQVGSLFVITEEEIVISAYAEGEDVSPLIGSTQQEVLVKYPHREICFFEKKEVDNWLRESIQLPHYLEQRDFLKRHAMSKVHSKKTVKNKNFLQDHFVLEAIKGWWRRVLPNSYGLFFRIEGDAEKNFLLVVRGQSVDVFHEPDFQSMGEQRSRDPEQVIRYLSEKHMLPIQGFFVSDEDWSMWSEKDPWKDITKSLQQKRTRLIPRRKGLSLLIKLRSYFGI